MPRGLIKSYRDLEVYQAAFAAAMEIFEVSKRLPVEEKYSLTDQIRRSSRSVCANFRRSLAKTKRSTLTQISFCRSVLTL